eukprot:CAMPEP_0174731128 /NCGR_PEP_ID=MMETSP1094-20130205/56940_1 /TAXON_ID=156173 /ORGANISM="Chrysochromulina brevifilum, Strain UTEX LB 985" /LENGTH=35 /DNA_ID= /DNA_START= /DNA_END= /DNA_ORIENTATION=
MAAAAANHVNHRRNPLAAERARDGTGPAYPPPQTA